MLRLRTVSHGGPTTAIDAMVCLVRFHDISNAYSPLVVADFLVRKLSELHRHTKGKHLEYVEIGTRDGDNVACVAQLSHHTIGPGAIIANAVEQSPRRCLALRNRSAVMLPHGGGFGVIEGSVNESTIELCFQLQTSITMDDPNSTCQ